MSAVAASKIFGLRVGVQPKFVLGALAVLAGMTFWLNVHNSEGSPAAAMSAFAGKGTADAKSVRAGKGKGSRRNRIVVAERGKLEIRAVDATREDIDPTLRLELLTRIRSLGQAKSGRCLFDIVPEAPPPVVIQEPIAPVVVASPQIAVAAPPVIPKADIPLKFYGFVHPPERGQELRGLFLEGDKILVAAQGEVIDHRYLVRELNAGNARLDDLQIKQGQTLPAVPEANQ